MNTITMLDLENEAEDCCKNELAVFREQTEIFRNEANAAIESMHADPENNSLVCTATRYEARAIMCEVMLKAARAFIANIHEEREKDFTSWLED